MLGWHKNGNYEPFQSGAIESVYVIHARKFTDRAAHMKREMARFEIPFEFIEPFDADTLDAGILERYFAPDARLSPGQKSASLKHFEAMRRVADKNQRLALIFEDDVMLAQNFIEELGKIVEEARGLAAPYTIQIGCANNMYVPRHLLVPGRRLYEAHEVRAADAYLIGAETARIRVDWLEHGKIHLPPDHILTFIDREKHIRTYWSEPTLVEQGSMNGLFNSVLEENRKAKPLWHLKFRFWWQRLRKKYIYRLFR